MSIFWRFARGFARVPFSGFWQTGILLRFFMSNFVSLLASAQNKAGLEDFGEYAFLEPFRQYVRYLNESPFTPEGREQQLGLVERWLVNRLRLAADLAAHPEILEEDVSDPIVILGFPRTGTTVLQRMISADPCKQALEFWRVLNPAPFPGEAHESPTARIAFAQAVEDETRRHNPLLFAAHPSLAREADEDWFIHQMTFQHVGNVFAGIVTPEYLAYLNSLPRLPGYRYVADVLRCLQWQDGGRCGRRWVLKSPIHMGCIEEMLAVHPGAVFVYPTRDLKTVMASYCHALQSSIGTSLAISPETIGSLSMAFWKAEMRRFHDARQRLGARLNLIEIPYKELMADPVEKICEIYRRAGDELAPDSERAIRSWIADNPAGKHGKNEYSLDTFGLTESMVEAAFSEFETK